MFFSGKAKPSHGERATELSRKGRSHMTTKENLNVRLRYGRQNGQIISISRLCTPWKRGVQGNTIHFRLMKGNDFYEKNNWHETVFRAFIPDHAGGMVPATVFAAETDDTIDPQNNTLVQSEALAEDPSEDPSEDTSGDPSEGPSEDASEGPSEDPSEDPFEDPSEDEVEILAEDEIPVEPITSYHDFLDCLIQLETYASTYAQEHADEERIALVINYIRTGVEKYNSGTWNTFCGEENTAFVNFVADQDEANNTSARRLRQLEAFTLPNGDWVELAHMFGCMDMAYHTGIQSTADLGSWAGDICDLLQLTTNGGVTGTVEEMAEEIRTNNDKYFLLDDPAVHTFGRMDLAAMLSALS